MSRYNKPLNLDDIEKISSEFLNAEDISEYLRTDPHSIRVQARIDPEKLGFPVIVTGSRVKIPKAGFLYYCRYGRQVLQVIKG